MSFYLSSSFAAPPPSGGDCPQLSVDLIALAEVAHVLDMLCYEGLHLHATSCSDLPQARILITKVS